MGIAFMLFAWLLIGGGITGGHYNPAVTLGVLIADDHMVYDLIMAIMMMMAQFAGAAAGCGMAYLTLLDPMQADDTKAGIPEQYIHMLEPALGVSAYNCFLVESLCTFVFVLVIL